MSANAPASFTPPSLLMATIGLSLATFMQVLDTTIANVALPTISGNLGVKEALLLISVAQPWVRRCCCHGSTG